MDSPTSSPGQGPAGSITPISNGRTEAQIAQEYRERALKMLEEVALLLTKARQLDGMTISFQIAGPDGFNRYNVAVLEITKKLC